MRCSNPFSTGIRFCNAETGFFQNRMEALHADNNLRSEDLAVRSELYMLRKSTETEKIRVGGELIFDKIRQKLPKKDNYFTDFDPNLLYNRYRIKRARPVAEEV